MKNWRELTEKDLKLTKEEIEALRRDKIETRQEMKKLIADRCK